MSVHWGLTRYTVSCRYADFVSAEGMAGAKEKGRVRQESKEYVVQEGDIMLFKFNV